MFKDKVLVIGVWVVVQMAAIFFKLSVAENLSWWWIFTPLFFVILSFLVSEVYNELKK